MKVEQVIQYPDQPEEVINQASGISKITINPEGLLKMELKDEPNRVITVFIPPRDADFEGHIRITEES